jgi:N,N'-diacetyllegionaminate synthase
MTKIIAEIGWNHMGDLELAKKMILASKESGADFVKFQTWSLTRLKEGPWDKDGRKEIYEKAELSFDDHIKIKNYCDSLDVQFFSSVFSIPDAEMLAQVQHNYVKIASFESRNILLLQACDDLFDTFFISTGTSTIDEIKKSLSHIHKSKVVLLHCVSSYPLLYENANLPQITRLKKISEVVGYSDHTGGVEGAKTALEYDIQFIEKHFTIDHNLPGRDNKFAVLPHELKELREYIDIRNQMSIDHGDVLLDCEADARKVMSGRFDG